MLRILETTSADGLRAQVIAYMCDHLEDYQSLPIEAINGDMPSWLQYSSIEDRITAMAQPKQLAGELEIIATSKVLNIAIRVVNDKGDDVQMYGDPADTQLLTVQFTSLGEDVGHYNLILCQQKHMSHKLSKLVVTKLKSSSAL